MSNRANTSPHRRTVLNAVCQDPHITAREIENKYGISKSTAQDHLKVCRAMLADPESHPNEWGAIGLDKDEFERAVQRGAAKPDNKSSVINNGVVNNANNQTTNVKPVIKYGVTRKIVVQWVLDMVQPSFDSPDDSPLNKHLGRAFEDLSLAEKGLSIWATDNQPSSVNQWKTMDELKSVLMWSSSSSVADARRAHLVDRPECGVLGTGLYTFEILRQYLSADTQQPTGQTKFVYTTPADPDGELTQDQTVALFLHLYLTTLERVPSPTMYARIKRMLPLSPLAAILSNFPSCVWAVPINENRVSQAAMDTYFEMGGMLSDGKYWHDGERRMVLPDTARVGQFMGAALTACQGGNTKLMLDINRRTRPNFYTGEGKHTGHLFLYSATHSYSKPAMQALRTDSLYAEHKNKSTNDPENYKHLASNMQVKLDEQTFLGIVSDQGRWNREQDAAYKDLPAPPTPNTNTNNTTNPLEGDDSMTTQDQLRTLIDAVEGIPALESKNEKLAGKLKQTGELLVKSEDAVKDLSQRLNQALAANAGGDQSEELKRAQAEIDQLRIRVAEAEDTSESGGTAKPTGLTPERFRELAQRTPDPKFKASKLENKKSGAVTLAVKNLIPLCVTGPAGLGKSYGVQQVCACERGAWVQVNLSKETSRNALFARTVATNGSTHVEMGTLVLAMLAGVPFIADEIDHCDDPNLISMLHAVVAEGRIYVPELNRDIVATGDFVFIATANSIGDDSGDYDGYTGTAMLDRMAVCKQIPPTPKREASIIKAQVPGTGDELAGQIAQMMADLRKSTPDAGCPFSIRRSIDLARWVQLNLQAGKSEVQAKTAAIQYALIDRFTPEAARNISTEAQRYLGADAQTFDFDDLTADDDDEEDEE